MIRFTPMAMATLLLCGCLYIPGFYGDRKPVVSGRILDTDGQPIEGAVVHAVLIQSSGGGNFHNSPKWYDVKSHDRFLTGKDGTYYGRLAYTDKSLLLLSSKAVFYYACKAGFEPFPLYIPKHRTAVIKRVGELPHPQLSKIPLEYSMAIRSGGCL